ncbi:MAG: OmpA family protein [Terracidiphilus sp.]|jgi:outer membrane protein OmpA-like peptidoglycan-associated protein
MYSKMLKSVSLALAVAALVFLPTGCQKAPPVTLSAVAAPPAIFPGEPVTVTATPGSLDTNNKKLSVLYTWSGTGVTGNGQTATVATSALAPGSYTVKAEVKEGKAGKEGLKPGQSADASASFTVKEFEPPTISCSASPSNLKPGDGSTVTAVGVSPQNRPLTYTFAASAGSISGSGATAAFSSAGAPTGDVGITCNVADDKGHTATASTSVTITKPYVAPVPHTQALATISYGKDAKRPSRADNEAKAVLDEIALDLQKQPDAKLVVVGEANAKEQAKTAKEKAFALKHKHAKVVDLAAERAVNVKDYLVTEKGIDASRISVATGTADAQQVENYLVPAGANFAADVAGTTPVDETVVKPEVRKPLPTKAAHKKAAMKM